MESETITLKIAYTAKDLRYFLFRAKTQTIVLTVAYVFVALFIVYVVASHVVTKEISESFRITAVAYLISAPLLTAVINLFVYDQIARKTAAAGSPRTLEIGETGITAKGEHRTSIIGWGAYKKAIEYKDKFVLTTDLGHGLLIPKRCFDSPESLQSFKDLLERSLTGKVKEK